MGFRNPITSLSASQITPGTLPPGVLVPAGQISAGTLDLLVIAQGIAAGAVGSSQIAPAAVTFGKVAAGAIGVNELAANAITGKTIDACTITGSTLQTAASGQRVGVVSSGVSFYPGPAVGSTFDPPPAAVTATPLTGASGGSFFSLKGTPGAGTITTPEIDLYTGDLPAGGYQSIVNVAGDSLQLNGRPIAVVSFQDFTAPTVTAANATVTDLQINARGGALGSGVADTFLSSSGGAWYFGPNVTGIWSIQITATGSAICGTRAFVELDVGGSLFARAVFTSDNVATLSVPALPMGAGTLLRATVYQQSGASVTFNTIVHMNLMSRV